MYKAILTRLGWKARRHTPLRAAIIIGTATSIVAATTLWSGALRAALGPADGIIPEVSRTEQSWGKLMINRAISENPLRLFGRRIWVGLGTHAPSTIDVKPPRGATRMSGCCALDDGALQKGEFICAVRVDGGVLWKGPVVSSRAPSARFSVAVSGAHSVSLVTELTGAGMNYAHADWIELAFE